MVKPATCNHCWYIPPPSQFDVPGGRVRTRGVGFQARADVARVIRDAVCQNPTFGIEKHCIRVAGTQLSARGRLFATAKWSCNLAGTIDEALHHRARRAVLQGEDSDRPAGDRQFDRQFLDERMLDGELQHGPGRIVR